MSKGLGEGPLSPPSSNHHSPIFNDETQRQGEVQVEPRTPPKSSKLPPRVGIPYAEGHYDQSAINIPLPNVDRYGDPTLYHISTPQTYYAAQPTFMRTMPYQTPPESFADSAIHTRSGKALGSPISASNPIFSRRSRSPKPKRRERSQVTKKGGPMIDQPLSILTKDYKIPVRDMGLWVNRSVEDRMKEVEKRNGNIARPMNSFMLYRSAFAERVKQFCKENNHQVVSQVTGASWPLEPKNVREMYERFAIIERDNHQIAHPDYKFAPNKNKKRGFDDDDDSDDEWDGSSKSAKRGRTRQSASRSQSSTPFDGERIPSSRSSPYQVPIFHSSSYRVANPHGPAPLVVGPTGITNQYYQRTIAPYGQQIDDIKFSRVEPSYGDCDPSMSLVSLPHAEQVQLLDGGIPTQLVTQGSIFDSSLSQTRQDYRYIDQYSVSDPACSMPKGYDFELYPSQQDIIYQESFHPGLTNLTAAHDMAWIDPTQVPGNDFDNEFRNWG